jgi:hypothetical protein
MPSFEPSHNVTFAPTTTFGPPEMVTSIPKTPNRRTFDTHAILFVIIIVGLVFGCILIFLLFRLRRMELQLQQTTKNFNMQTVRELIAQEIQETVENLEEQLEFDSLLALPVSEKTSEAAIRAPASNDAVHNNILRVHTDHLLSTIEQNVINSESQEELDEQLANHFIAQAFLPNVFESMVIMSNAVPFFGNVPAVVNEGKIEELEEEEKILRPNVVSNPAPTLVDSSVISKVPVTQESAVRLADTQTGPTDTHTGPTDTQTGPTDTQTGPTDTQTGPTDTQTGPTVTSQEGPTDTQTGPTDTQTGSTDTQKGPTDTLETPNADAASIVIESVVDMSPSVPKRSTRKAAKRRKPNDMNAIDLNEL